VVGNRKKDARRTGETGGKSGKGSKARQTRTAGKEVKSKKRKVKSKQAIGLASHQANKLAS
jgi:hypothetical protein